MIDNSIIYSSPCELLQKIKEEAEHTQMPVEKAKGAEPLVPTGEFFECVRASDHSVVLIPPMTTLPMLFRGEEKEFEVSRPSLYRRPLQKVDYFIEKLKVFEMEVLLSRHPYVRKFAEQFHNWKIEIPAEGLAQHYGIKTPLMDFTSDPQVAFFFATCHYDSATDEYKICEPGEHIGVIYMMNPTFATTGKVSQEEPTIYNDYLSIIGGQPFSRPTCQRGYTIRLNKKETLSDVKGCYRYKFKYSQDESNWFYKYYKKGKKLWTKDFITEKASKIATKKVFSYASLDKLYHYLKVRGYKYKRIELAIFLHKRDIIFNDRLCDVDYNQEECQKLECENSNITIKYRKQVQAENGNMFISGSFLDFNDQVDINSIVHIHLFGWLNLLRSFYLAQ